MLSTYIYCYILVTSGGLAVKHSALGANDHRFDSSKRLKLIQGLNSWLTTLWVSDHVKWRCRLHWIIKNKGGRKTHWQWSLSGYFGSIFTYYSPVSRGKEIINHSNIEDVPNKRHPGDSPRKTKQTTNYLLRAYVTMCIESKLLAMVLPSGKLLVMVLPSGKLLVTVLPSDDCKYRALKQTK